MNDLGTPDLDRAAVDALAKCDPVYERTGLPRRCKLCGAEGRDKHAENISHAATCPWIYALKSRDEYGPGGKYDRRRCHKCGRIWPDGPFGTSPGRGGLNGGRECADGCEAERG